MSRTIHQPDLEIEASPVDFGRVFLCTCPPDGDDDPKCPALRECWRREKLRTRLQSTLGRAVYGMRFGASS